MANHASAEKRHRQNLKRRENNRFARSTFRTSIKKVLSLIESGQSEAAASEFRRASSLIDKAAIHGVIHQNTAQRTISRLQVRLNKALPESA